VTRSRDWVGLLGIDRPESKVLRVQNFAQILSVQSEVHLNRLVLGYSSYWEHPHEPRQSICITFHIPVDRVASLQRMTVWVCVGTRGIWLRYGTLASLRIRAPVGRVAHFCARAKTRHPPFHEGGPSQVDTSTQARGNEIQRPATGLWDLRRSERGGLMMSRSSSVVGGPASKSGDCSHIGSCIDDDLLNPVDAPKHPNTSLPVMM